MKKIFLALIALVGAMSMNAQVMKAYKNGKVVAKLYESQVDSIVFSEGTAPIGSGVATRTGDVEVTWVQLWKNGPKFAEYNLGAENNKAEDYGTYLNGKYARYDNQDAVTSQWGDNWRTPTIYEFNALLSKCDAQWTSLNGVNGYKFTGKDDYSDNSIFLPAAGVYDDWYKTVSNDGTNGYYWSSTAVAGGTYEARYLAFSSSSAYVTSYRDDKCYSYRPVLAEDSAVVFVGSINLDKTATTLTVGVNIPLIATVLPENATDKTLTWSTTNEAVATVSTEGIITAKAAGTATITATSVDGDEVTATCVVTVIAPGNLKEGSFGTATRTGDVSVKWIQLWENSPKFAEYNIGAENNSTLDYGNLYCWGKNIHNDPDMSYNTGTNVLSGNDDTATNLWGNKWRMPKKDEFNALLTNCTYVWLNYNGVNGMLFTGKEAYANNTLFLPASGYCFNSNIMVQGSYGHYWTSTPCDDKAYELCFFVSNQFVRSFMRNDGLAIRAVLQDN